MGFSDVDAENKPVSFQQTFETKRSTHLQELQQKEDDMRQMFVLRVKEKEAEIKEEERQVRFPLPGATRIGSWTSLCKKHSGNTKLSIQVSLQSGLMKWDTFIAKFLSSPKSLCLSGLTHRNLDGIR